jgi:hypothetical protein
MPDQKAGIILFCTYNGQTRYLLENESKWVKDLVRKEDWKPEFQTVTAKTMKEAIQYFKSIRPTIQSLLPDLPIHHAHITNEGPVYKTKWMVPHPTPKFGFPKGGCSYKEDLYSCAKREFEEETLTKLNADPIDSISFAHDDTEFEFFIVEIEYDSMNDILERFYRNKAFNGGDGVEPNELALFTRRQLEIAADNGDTNWITKKMITILLKRRRGGGTR